MDLLARHRYYLELAREASLASPDPSTKTGAILVDATPRGIAAQPKDKLATLVLAKDCNRFPPGVLDLPERWNVRETKYEFVIHAEINILTGLLYGGFPVALKDCTLYVYGPIPPCSRCAGPVSASGIRNVVFSDFSTCEDPLNKEAMERWKTRSDIAAAIFAENGVATYMIKTTTVKEATTEQDAHGTA